LVFAEFASENWPIKEKYQESRKVAGSRHLVFLYEIRATRYEIQTMDPIADMLTRIRNAQAVLHRTVMIPFSQIKFNLAKILEKEKLVDKVDTQGKKSKKVIKLELKYKNNLPVINSLKRISRPGLRVYIKKDELKPIRQGFGLIIISTSEGLMTNREAKEKKLGGEVLCEIW
jgi:small subunit ribosomal protein S8